MFTPPIQTGIPLLVDNNFQNTIDFHVAATNLLKLLDTYLNEVATGYSHNYTQTVNDPITDEAQFFVNLNKGTLDLASQQSGINANTNGTITVKIDPKLTLVQVWQKDNNGNVINRVNNGIIEWLAIDTSTNITQWIATDQNVFDIVKQYTNKLDRNFGVDKLNEEFILYWIEKFKTSHQLVQQSYQNLVTDSTQDMFTDFSDSIGLLARVEENVCNSVLPLSDPELDRLDVIPRPFNVVLDDKLDNNTKQTIFEMSKKNEVLYRYNLVKIINLITTSAQTHGENLVTDEIDYNRFLILVDELNGIISNTLGKISRIFFYIRNLPAINQQQSQNISYKTIIEETVVNIDILKNKIQQLTSPRLTLSSLSAANT